jgi:hypothetical protein
MKLCSGILKHASNKADDEQFHFYNSLLLIDDISFQRTHFRKAPTNIPQLYTPNAATEDDEEPPLQKRRHDQNNTLLKIVKLIAINASTKEITQAIIDAGISCCVTPYFEDFLNQPTPIQNTTFFRQRNLTTQSKRK